MQYPPTELVLNEKGQVYHLGLHPDEVANKIILVGDQDRVHLVASFFDTIEHTSQHREFTCKTGTYRGKRITALSTGIGTDNIDITLNELDALFNIDLESREDKKNITTLDIVRIGTCGILQADIPVHGYLLSQYAFGLDNIAHFYQIPWSQDELTILSEILGQVIMPDHIRPYVAGTSDDLFNRLESDKTHSGITITSSGFYGPQGRQLRLHNRTQYLNDMLSAFSMGKLKIINFEMESSALFAIGKALGHHCATICLGIANRPNKEFSKGYHHEMMGLIEYVLNRL